MLEARSPAEEELNEIEADANSSDSGASHAEYQRLIASFDDNVELLMDLLPSIEHILDFEDALPIHGQLPGYGYLKSQSNIVLHPKASLSDWVKPIASDSSDSECNKMTRLPVNLAKQSQSSMPLQIC